MVVVMLVAVVVVVVVQNLGAAYATVERERLGWCCIERMGRECLLDPAYVRLGLGFVWLVFGSLPVFCKWALREWGSGRGGVGERGIHVCVI